MVENHGGQSIVQPTGEEHQMTNAKDSGVRPAGLRGANAVRDISGTLTTLLADAFALYVKTKNFHWHVSGPHFRDYHLLMAEPATQTFAMPNTIPNPLTK